MAVVKFKHYPLADKGMSWSFSAEDGNKLIERGGWELFKDVHTWYDDSEGSVPEKKEAYKLPHHKEVDGEVKTVWRGVAAAMTRLMQRATQIPDDERRAVYNHLVKHYDEFEEEPPEFHESMSDEQLRDILVKAGFSDDEAWSILKAQEDKFDAGSTAPTYGKPTAKQLAKINKLSKRPLSEDEVFVFTAKLIGDGIVPSRMSKISLPLLREFKKDALTGVSFLIDHPWAGFFGRPKAAIPYGRTFDAVLRELSPDERVNDETIALFADHYIVRGIEIDGIKTDSIISLIETGIGFDTSIGWYAEKPLCSICSNDIRDCEHWPGEKYDEGVCLILWHPPGGLMENSLVFDGAYPSAGVLSNTGHGYEVNNAFDVVDNIKDIPADTKVYATYSSSKGRLLYYVQKGCSKTHSIVVPNAVITLTDTEDASKEGDVKVEEFEIKLSKETVQSLFGDVPENIESKLVTLAKDGIRYRNDLIQEALEWGVRALGNDFDVEATKKLLSEDGRTIDDIKSHIELYKKIANQVLNPGRKTEPYVADEKVSNLPDEAFKVR